MFLRGIDNTPQPNKHFHVTSYSKHRPLGTRPTQWTDLGGIGCSYEKLNEPRLLGQGVSQVRVAGAHHQRHCGAWVKIVLCPTLRATLMMFMTACIDRSASSSGMLSVSPGYGANAIDTG